MTQPLQAFWGGKEQGQSDRRPENQAERREAKTKMDCLFLRSTWKILVLLRERRLPFPFESGWDDHVSWNYGCWIEIGFEETKVPGSGAKVIWPIEEETLGFYQKPLLKLRMKATSFLFPPSPQIAEFCSWWIERLFPTREETSGEDQIFREKNKSLGYLRWDIAKAFKLCYNRSFKTLHWICKP